MRLHRKLARKVQTCQRYRLMGLDERARGEEVDIRKLLDIIGAEVGVGDISGGIYISFNLKDPMIFLLLLPTYAVRTRIKHEWTLEYVPWSYRGPLGVPSVEVIIGRRKQMINNILENN